MPGIRLCRYERRAQRLCEMKKRNDRNTQTGTSADYHAPENDGEVVVAPAGGVTVSSHPPCLRLLSGMPYRTVRQCASARTAPRLPSARHYGVVHSPVLPIVLGPEILERPPPLPYRRHVHAH